MPTNIGHMIVSGQAAVAMGIAIVGWTGGFFMRIPIAGMLIAADGADKVHKVAPC